MNMHRAPTITLHCTDYGRSMIILPCGRSQKMEDGITDFFTVRKIHLYTVSSNKLCYMNCEIKIKGQFINYAILSWDQFVL